MTSTSLTGRTYKDAGQRCVMEMCITGYCVMDNAIHSTWKSQSAAFPRPANSVTHNAKRQASYTHSHNAGLLRRKPHPLFLSFIRAYSLKGGIIIKTVNTGYMVRAPTKMRTTPPQLNTATPQHLRSVGTAADTGGFFHTQNQKNIFSRAARRQKVRTLWHFLIPQSLYYRHLLSH